jgi:hypothetical protein
MMVKIRLINSVVGTDFSYQMGSEVKCSEERAKDLIRGNHAVLVGGVVKPQPETPEKRSTKPEIRKK